MKTSILKIVIAWLLATVTNNSLAAELYELRIQNPRKQIGYVVGDTFTRTLELDVKAPYKLSAASIPTKGLSRKGIELSGVNITEKHVSESTRYQIQLKYQIFTSGSTVKKLELAKQLLKIIHAGKSLTITVPAWQFRVSPLAVNGEVYIEKDMSQDRGPMLVESVHTKYLLGIFLSITFLAALGLIYINADRAWFPGMGEPFAMSYRKISSLGVSHNSANIALIQQATTSIHHAFNQTYGENVFAADIDAFLEKHPVFTNLRQEISHFFNESNNVLFTVIANDKAKITIASLLQFCEQCRHCERSVA